MALQEYLVVVVVVAVVVVVVVVAVAVVLAVAALGRSVPGVVPVSGRVDARLGRIDLVLRPREQASRANMVGWGRVGVL